LLKDSEIVLGLCLYGSLCVALAGGRCALRPR